MPAWTFGNWRKTDLPQLMLASSLLVFAGLGLGWWMYGRRPIKRAADADALERLQPAVFHALQQGLYMDQLYALTIQRLAWWIANVANWLDRWVWSGIPLAVAALTKGLGWIDFSLDRWVVNKGFDEGCNGVAGWRPAAGAVAGWTHPELSAVIGGRGGSAGSLSAAGTQGMSSTIFPCISLLTLLPFAGADCGAAAGTSGPLGSAPDRRDLRHRRGCVHACALVPLPACAARACSFRNGMRGSRRLGFSTTSASMALAC